MKTGGRPRRIGARARGAIPPCSRYMIAMSPIASESEKELLVVVRGTEVLVERTGGALRFPDRALAETFAESSVRLGQFGGTIWHAASFAVETKLAPNLVFATARSLFAELDEATLTIVGRAIAAVEFETMTRFCGRCAAKTEANPSEGGKRCPSCSATFYPRIAPAVIVLVEREGRLLLARGARHPPGMASALAGFVEAGESLEEAAVREVQEEVSLTITDLRYFGNQPWPFGHSLMIGFFARHAAGEIEVDGNEIVEANWFTLDALPVLPPPFTIARKLIDAYRARTG